MLHSVILFRTDLDRRLRKIKLMEVTSKSVLTEVMLLKQPSRLQSEGAERREKRSSLVQVYADLRQSSYRLSKELDDYINPFIAPGCRALFNSIQQCLPRELRDMIHVYLLSPYLDIEIRKDRQGNLQVYNFDNSHLVNPAFAESFTRHELLESWYKLGRFTFANLDLVARFLHTDLWGLGLPVKKLVRNLEIRMRDFGDWTKRRSESFLDRFDITDCLLTVNTGVRLIFPILFLDRRKNGSELGLGVAANPERSADALIVVGMSRYSLSVRRLLDSGHEVIVDLGHGSLVHVTREHLDDRAVWREAIMRCLAESTPSG
jgi:hypothetical protein